ncbi:MAG: SgcJ/EcaC family oxidoreductase [Phycisphaerae bacterium]|nr:SgcJ/EcaC family oxidoreductase [Phycisphaerae bacterium]NNF41598.1 SgcJ/EcaC family oxidoreductase [Phycisphaerales bacterium]
MNGCATRAAIDHDEHDAVLAVIDSWNEGWKTRNAALAVADYAEDADWTNAFGDRFQGRVDLLAGLEFIFSLDFVMTGDSAGNTYEDVTFLSDDVALIRSQLTRTGQMTGTGEVMKDRSINHLRVLQRRDDRWVVVSHLISQAKEKGSQ